jgi:divinyl protochlorophyllide a 8-vinyl-reductase
MWSEGPIIAERACIIPPSVTLPPAGQEQALIGPHAIIHLAEAMRERLGPARCEAVLASAQIAALPDGRAMIPEIAALHAHRSLVRHAPDESHAIAREAARRTADYIIANRIPGPAAALLRALPARCGAPLLMRAIRRHAWTFIGAGRFEPHGAWSFTIDRTIAHDPMPVPATTFDWYAAVFARLYQQLVSPRARCRDDGAPDAAPLRHLYRISLSPA